MFHRDNDALEGMPLKLAIVSILLSISTPMVLGSLSSFQDQSASLIYREERDRLKQTAEQVLLAGPGNVRSMQLHLPINEGKMVLGGELEWQKTRISIELPGLAPSPLYLNDPLVRFKTFDPQGQVLQGECWVTLRCVLVGDQSFVEVLA